MRLWGNSRGEVGGYTQRSKGLWWSMLWWGGMWGKLWCRCMQCRCCCKLEVTGKEGCGCFFM